MDTFYLGAYWGGRRESAPRCGERFAQCLARFSEIDEALGSWFRKASRKAAAKTPVDLDPDSLTRLLMQGRSRRDDNREVIDELGFSFGLWNRATPEVGMNGTVGADPSSPGLMNRFILDFPPPEAEALRLYEPTVAEAILEAVVSAWEPNWATWVSLALHKVQEPAPREPVVGWLTYLATPISVDLPGVTSRPVRGGAVLRIGQNITDAAEQSVLDLRTRLAKLAALRPIP